MDNNRNIFQKAPVASSAFSAVAPARSGLMNAGVNFFKSMFNQAHALLPTSLIHLSVPRGKSSRGVEVSATNNDIVVGCRI